MEAWLKKKKKEHNATYLSQWKGHAYRIFWNKSISEVSQPAAHTAVTSLLHCVSTIFPDPECPAGRPKTIDKYWHCIAAFLLSA